MSDEPRSTDFPGQPFGPGDTITTAPALELEHQAPELELGDRGDTSRSAAAQRDESDPPTTGGLTIYRVTAPTKILGHEPGTLFGAALKPELERRLLQRGQLIIAKSSGRPARPAGATAPGNTTTGGSTP